MRILTRFRPGLPAPVRAYLRRRQGRPRVLLAEDDVTSREVACLMLEELGCEVTRAADGREAVAAFTAGAFDLILMDCEMPGMDGYAATAEIRSLERHGGRVPIVALTAHVSDRVRKKCAAAGMDGHISKPVPLPELRAALARHAEGGVARGDLGEVRRLTGAKYREVVATFITNADGVLRRLEEGRMTPTLLREVHSLKSASRYMGALALGDAAERVEEGVRAGTSTDGLIADMAAVWAEVRGVYLAEATGRKPFHSRKKPPKTVALRERQGFQWHRRLFIAFRMGRSPSARR